MCKYEIFSNMKKIAFLSLCFIVSASLYSCKQKKDTIPASVIAEEMARLEAIEDSIPSPNDYTDTIFGIPLEMVYVGRGSLQLGGYPERDGERIFGDEKPVHTVDFSGYFISRYPVTQALWEAVMGYNPSEFQDNAMNPVSNVSWDEALLFCTKLNLITGQWYTLPSEAQWEYAARGGKGSRGTMYSGSNILSLVGRYSRSTPCPVGQYKPNELGLYDMSGGVWEWCRDWLGEYSADSVFNPIGPEYGFHKVLRGGSWNSDPLCCRIAHRSGASTNTKTSTIGFRVVMNTYQKFKPRRD